jgi:hypothetical protein
MMAPAGTVIPESPPGNARCGTNFSGWMKTKHPSVGSESKEMTICFQ